MRKIFTFLMLALSIATSTALATDEPGAIKPPTQAFQDCIGKKAGDVVQHTSREGKVAAVCENSPDGLVARPSKTQAVTKQTTVKKADSAFRLTSDVGNEGGTLPKEYSCDGAGSSPALTWSTPPAGTKEFALLMTTLPVDGSTKWDWVLYGIPNTKYGLVKNSSGVGTLGVGSHGATMSYEPPCSKGPGAKVYTFTLYALSRSPVLPINAIQITGEVLTKAIAPITIESTSLNLSYSKP